MKCDACMGTGKIKIEFKGEKESMDCNNCDGTGKVGLIKKLVFLKEFFKALIKIYQKITITGKPVKK
jgi:DnaJ-class molecular chaperone